MNSLKAFKMSYFTPLHRVLYHIIVSILAPTSGHKTDVKHIGLYLFHGILHQVRINMGAFMIKYMQMCKDDFTKGLAYRRIVTRIFARYRVSFEGMIGTKPSDTDHIDGDSFKRLHFIF